MGGIIPFADEAFRANYTGAEWFKWIWMVLAVITVRNLAMSLNRVLDAEIDAKNPRTKDRALPQGLITKQEVWLFTFLNLIAFIFICGQINKLCLLLSPVIIILIIVYSYSKRFTAARHFILGAVHFFGPICGWIAVTETWSLIPICVGTANWMWITGKDILYSLQDELFQQREKLHGLPVLLGAKKSIIVARITHMLAVALLIVAGYLSNLNGAYYLGVSLAAAILLYQHKLVKPFESQKVPELFFKIDVWFPISLFVFTFIAIFFS
jgi:4-hydroxybenzoate polyprenyltransferase